LSCNFENIETSLRSTIREDKTDVGSRQEDQTAAISDNLEEISRSDSAAGVAEYDIETRYNNQVARLAKLRQSIAAIATNPVWHRSGNEHLIEFRGDRVWKYTYDNGQNPEVRAHFGYAVDSNYYLVGSGGYEGKLILRPSTPYEYIQRLNWQNEIFGDDLRIEGIHEHNGAIGLSISQRTIDGCEPSHSEIHSNMESRGFKKVPASIFNNQHISDKTWYDPSSRILVSDAKPDNFKKDQEGGIVPIDLLIQKLPEGSDLHEILIGALSNPLR
jgi:hypothetical protein